MHIPARIRSNAANDTATGTSAPPAPAGAPTGTVDAAEALGKAHDDHIAHYGAGIDQRLTGLHETAPWTEYSYCVSDRGASVRIPWQVKVEGKGYLEDRRPNANMDPYVVTRLITETVCKDVEG